MKYTKDLEQLKDKLASIDGEWLTNQENKKVFKFGKALLNWFPSTGTIQFQGKLNDKEALQKKVSDLLSENGPNLAVGNLEILPEVVEEKNQNESFADFLNAQYDNTELVIGIVSPVGTEISRVINPLNGRLAKFNYEAVEIKLSSLLEKSGDSFVNEYERISEFMKRGDEAREASGQNSILGFGAAKLIRDKRDKSKKQAFIVNSLKHPEEVDALKRIYGNGFYLFGIHADEKRRLKYLIEDKMIQQQFAEQLTKIDEDEKVKFGQRTRDTYHLSDFFVNFNSNDDLLKNSIQRFLELIFGNPFNNPTFDEYSMFMAFSTSARSGDLSRQVGAIITKNNQVLSTGANEVPKFGGGQYWSELDVQTGEVCDKEDGKDYTRNEDSNKREQLDIINSIISEFQKKESLTENQQEILQDVLNKSRITDLTEFGRVVHAEMEALLACARVNIDCSGSNLYCTTFPCHNCAKHIVSAGVKKVFYVEPYPKSKALDFHSDSIMLKDEQSGNTQDFVIFEPFTGVGPRRFLDFFSLNLGNGVKVKRKDSDGVALEWDAEKARARVPLLSVSYIEVEREACNYFEKLNQGPG